MTFREKLLQDHPEKRPLKFTAIGCPDDYGYEEQRPCWSKENGRDYEPCFKCWNRPMPKTNLVVGDSKVEHPDTDMPKVGCASWTGSDMDPWITHDPSKSVTINHTMLGTENMYISSGTIPISKILDGPTKPRIICISGKAQHGKDTTAGYLKEYLEEKGKRVLIAHYGDLVKYICTTFFGWDGQKDERGRSLLQEVGTDTIRAKTPDFWVRFIKDVIDHFPDKWDYVIIPDCRFPNEVDYLKEHGYSVKHVRVIRSNFISPLTIEQQKHASEVALDEVIPDVILFNTFGLEELRYAVRNRGLDQ